MQIANQCFTTHFFLTNSHFQFYFHSTPFLEKEKRVGFVKIYSRVWNVFGDPLKGSRKKKKKKRHSKCPTSLQWLSASKFRTLKSNISQEDYYGFKKIIVRQFSLTVDPNLRKAIFYSRQFYKNLSYFTFYSKYERKLQLDRRNVWSELREKN